MTQRGFTLVEVLVALAILVFAIMALMQSMGVAAVNTAMLDERTAAYMVAADKLVELQVYQRWPENGTTDEKLEPPEDDEHGRTWLIRTIISNGPYPDTRRVDIEVGPETRLGGERQVLYILTSLLGRPAPETMPLDGAAEGNDPPPEGAG